jgi:HTH-type transcriptional regulator / antitoxin HipB
MRIGTAVDLGNQVRERRQTRGLTQVQLAKLAGVSRLWLVHVELGHPGAEFGKVLQLLSALDVTVDLVDRATSRPTTTTLRDLLDRYDRDDDAGA